MNLGPTLVESQAVWLQHVFSEPCIPQDFYKELNIGPTASKPHTTMFLMYAVLICIKKSKSVLVVSVSTEIHGFSFPRPSLAFPPPSSSLLPPPSPFLSFSFLGFFKILICSHHGIAQRLSIKPCTFGIPVENSTQLGPDFTQHRLCMNGLPVERSELTHFPFCWAGPHRSKE